MRTVGYGENETERAHRDAVPQGRRVGARHRRRGVGLDDAAGRSAFEMGESMCNGDSGGPALDATTGAIVGIVFRGGACTDPSGHIYTSLAGSANLTEAFAMAGGAPNTEGEPYPDAGGAMSG